MPFNNTNLQNKYGTPGNQTAAQQAAERNAIQHGTAEAKTDASNAYNKMSPANQSRVNNAESQAKSHYNNYYGAYSADHGEEKANSKESSEGMGATRNEAGERRTSAERQEGAQRREERREPRREGEERKEGSERR